MATDSIPQASTPRGQLLDFPVLSNIVDPLKDQVYFGITLTGAKDHAGMELTRFRRNTIFIGTFCGSEMIAEDVSVGLDFSRSRYFCKICYKALKQRVFDRLVELKEQKQLASDRLYALIAQSARWSGGKWRQEAGALAADLARIEQDLFTFTASLSPEEFREAYRARERARGKAGKR